MRDYRTCNTRDFVYKALRQRAAVASGHWGNIKLKAECERLFGVRPYAMSERQMHLCVAWLTCLNVIAAARQKTRDAFDGA